ncbi:unnamed protein product [Phytophthora lilii]|uniref:Unnamed protein product n=1 Tax=Phytophthora lilii TaxID=2077276 RepID=A0A9W6WXR4_9STRA|nr:unnamed protein product [Phytophthora lilii]
MYAALEDESPRGLRGLCCLRWTSSAPAIKLLNLQDGELLSHPLVLLDGVVTARGDDLFVAARLHDESATLWPVAKSSGRFKALVLLPRPGNFVVSLEVAGATRHVRVEYAPPQDTPYQVKFHFHRHQDEQPEPSPEDHEALQKLRFNVLVLQLAVAEMLRAAGKRRTFALQLAADGLPEVEMLQSCSFDGEDRIDKVSEAVEEDYNGVEFKHVIVTEGAGGNKCEQGEDIAIFDSAGLQSWPSCLREVSASCLSGQADENASFVSGIDELLHVLLSMFDEKLAEHHPFHVNRVLCAYEADPNSTLDSFQEVDTQGWLKLNYTALREVKEHGSLHLNTKSARKLLQCSWIWSPETVRMYGPVGTSKCESDLDILEEVAISAEMDPDEELQAVFLDAGTSLNDIQNFFRREIASRGELRSERNDDWFVLVDGEYIMRVDVCASSWIEGIQIHTNLRSSRWYGNTSGQKHEFKGPPGWYVATFFGSSSDSHVMTLGVKCLPLSAPLKARSEWPKESPHNDCPVKFFPAAGKALEHGPKTQFIMMPDIIAAVVVRCNTYVEAPFRVLTPDEVDVNCRDPTAYHSNDHVFKLFPGEQITKVETSSGHYLDAVRFTTTQRVSPWYGSGYGVDSSTVECPVNHDVCGFHGTHGKKFVGALGILYHAKAIPSPSHAEKNGRHAFERSLTR